MKQKWNNYIDFRDYLNAFPEKAIKYDECKQNLAKNFSDDHRRYTEGNKKLIAELIEEAKMWKKIRCFSPASSDSRIKKYARNRIPHFRHVLFF